MVEIHAEKRLIGYARVSTVGQTSTASWSGFGPPDETVAASPAQQKDAITRRAQGATLQELADSYDRSVATMRPATRAA